MVSIENAKENPYSTTKISTQQSVTCEQGSKSSCVQFQHRELYIVTLHLFNKMHPSGGKTNTKTSYLLLYYLQYLNLTSIYVSDSPKLIYTPLGVLLQNITPSLQQLSIYNCSKFQGFLEDGEHLNNNKDGEMNQHLQTY